MVKLHLLFQTLSLPIAYILTNIYINIDNYIEQLDRDFNIKLPTIPVDFYLAVAIFVVLFIAPNVYVFALLRMLKKDLIEGKITRDVEIIPHDDHIEVGGRDYTISEALDHGLTGLVLISIFPFTIDFSSLVPTLFLLALYIVMLIVMAMVYDEGSLVLDDPYLRLKYHVVTLQSGEKTLVAIMEKEFERPRFTEYIFDWIYDHSVLVGFKVTKRTK